MIKAQVRRIARRMAGYPVIGRLVRIGVAVVRLPEFRDSIQNAMPVPVATAANLNTAALFQTEQLPSLLQAISDVNHRQIIEANAHSNLARSVPITLRKLTRDIVQLRENSGEQRAKSIKLCDENAQLRADSAELRANCVRLGDEIAQLRADSIKLREGNEALLLGLQKTQTLIEQIRTDSLVQQEETRAIAAETRDRTLQLGKMNQSVGYLLGRVEFVRREVMFEMRYGARPVEQGRESLVANTEVLAVDKLALARTTGVRLNIGCGHVPLEGYINVDRRALPGVDVVAEADRLPFERNELAEICSTHLLEHFPLEQLRRELLPYWTSLLRDDGVFRVVVPDGAGMAHAFVENEYSFENLRQVTFGGQDYDGDFHYNMFSVESLSQLLREAGLSNVEVVAENRENGGCKEFELIARR